MMSASFSVTQSGSARIARSFSVRRNCDEGRAPRFGSLWRSPLAMVDALRVVFNSFTILSVAGFRRAFKRVRTHRAFVWSPNASHILVSRKFNVFIKPLVGQINLDTLGTDQRKNSAPLFGPCGFQQHPSIP